MTRPGFCPFTYSTPSLIFSKGSTLVINFFTSIFPQSFKCTEAKVIAKIQSSLKVMEENDKINRISNKGINIGNIALEETLKNDTTSPQQVQQGCSMAKINSRSNSISSALSHTTKMVSNHQPKPSKVVGRFTSSNIGATRITQPPNVSR